jgi:hypothetical protein
MSMAQKKMKANTIFRQIDELLAGVHGDLPDGEIVKRTAALIAQGDRMPAAAWLVCHHATPLTSV